MSEARNSRRARLTQWVARSTVVAVLAAATLGFASSHKRVTVDHNGAVVTVTTFGSTVADALSAAGITVAEGEFVAPGPAEQLSDGDVVAVRSLDLATDAITRSDTASRTEVRGPLVSVTLVTKGERAELTTHAADVRTLLQEQSIALAETDVVSPGLDEPLADGAEVSVSESTSKAVTVTEEIAFETTTTDDPDLKKGKKVVDTKGVPGERTTTYSVVIVDGEEVSRTEVATGVTKEPTDEVVRVGTQVTVDVTVPKSSAVSAGSARAIAKEMVLDRGWDEDEFACLDALWQRESGWRTTAGNKSSGAYGIPQALPGSKMASAGADWRTSASTQIKWGLGYIKGRYKTPCGAWAFFKARNWY